ncbi:hypothetical protein GCM10010433_63310 [Streptomyces pulveraceus]
MDLRPNPEPDPCEGNGAVKDAGTPVAWRGHRPEALTAWNARQVRLGVLAPFPRRRRADGSSPRVTGANPPP